MQSLPQVSSVRIVNCPACGAFVRYELSSDEPLLASWNKCEVCKQPSAVLEKPDRVECEVPRHRRLAVTDKTRKRAYYPRLPGISRIDPDYRVKTWAREWLSLKRCTIKKRGIALCADVTVDGLVQLWKFQNGRCALSGREMVIPAANNTGGGNKNGPRVRQEVVSVDRKNSDIPYQYDNLQLVCYMANCLKTNLPQREFVEWCRDIAEFSVPNTDS